MVRILQVVANLGIKSGMTGVVINYHRFLDPSRVQFDYLYFDESETDYRQEIEQLGGRVFKISRPRMTQASTREIDRFFAAHEGEYTAIHCHPAWSPAVFARAAKRHGIQHVIAHSHNTKFSDKRLSAVRNGCLQTMAGLFATEFMACSEDAKKTFPLIPNKKIILLNNAIDTKRFVFNPVSRRRIRTEIGIDNKTILIGHVGRFVPQKNHKFLIEIFIQLRKSLPDAKLLLVGSGPLQGNVEQQIRKSALDTSVILLGERRDIADIYSAMDVFILPSVFEGLGIVLLEAQASGLPCIASDCVPNEAQVTPLLRFCSLKDPAGIWVREIQRAVEECNVERSSYDSISAFAEKHYDIASAADEFMNFYERLN